MKKSKLIKTAIIVLGSFTLIILGLFAYSAYKNSEYYKFDVTQITSKYANDIESVKSYIEESNTQKANKKIPKSFSEDKEIPEEIILISVIDSKAKISRIIYCKEDLKNYSSESYYSIGNKVNEKKTVSMQNGELIINNKSIPIVKFTFLVDKPTKGFYTLEIVFEYNKLISRLNIKNSKIKKESTAKRTILERIREF
jgi:hypothetical protein